MADTVLPYKANAIISHSLKGDSGFVPEEVNWSTTPFTPTRDLEYLPGEEGSRVVGTLTIEDGAQADDTLVCTATLTAPEPLTICGAGWFTDGGHLFGVTSFTGIGVDSPQEIVFVWKLIGK